VSRSGLSRVWSVLGALLALYAIGTWIIVQGGKSFAEIPGLDGRAQVVSAYEATLAVGILLGVLSAVGIQYMRKPAKRGETLLPVVAIADLGPHQARSWSMRLYQAFFVLVFLLIPAAALLQLNGIILDRGVLWHQGDAALGSIALKNAFALTRGSSDQDAKEYACRDEVTRVEGFVWLANMRCDIAKDNQLQPFDKAGRSLPENAQSVKSSCTRDLALPRSTPEACRSVRDISEYCEASERRCRGMQWLPILSPILPVATTIFGWLMLVWLLGEACYRKLYGVTLVADEFLT
jgi:hypothetical protein